MQNDGSFDPGRFLTKLKGSDYLEVKWRLLWLRTSHPDAHVETEMVSHDGNTAVFRAKVAIPGGGTASGWGSETYNDFRDYIEKAETKSLGRALAALGFGTQFCPDFADDAAVDEAAAPAERRGGASRTAQGSQSATNRRHPRNNDAGRPQQQRPAAPNRQPPADDSPVIQAWSRNLRNASTPAALERVVSSLAENGLRDHPALAPLISEREKELMADVAF